MIKKYRFKIDTPRCEKGSELTGVIIKVDGIEKCFYSDSRDQFFMTCEPEKYPDLFEEVPETSPKKEKLCHEQK